MALHAQAHAQNDLIKIGRVRKTNELRPEQHVWNYNTGSYFFGSDAVMDDTRLPPSIRRTRGILKCTVCNSFERPGMGEMSWQQKSQDC